MTSIDMFARLVVALLAGGAIGFERQWRRRSAGLRTHLMVSLASATFMLVSAHLVPYQHYGVDKPYITADVTRIASHVAVGISFLGAGAILRSHGRIKGLTTAASLWLSTALGLAAGAGMFLLTLLSTLAALFVLIVIRLWEFRMPKQHARVIRLVIGPDGPDHRAILRETASFIEVKRVTFEINAPRRTTRIVLHVGFQEQEQMAHLLEHLEALPDLRRLAVGHRLT